MIKVKINLTDDTSITTEDRSGTPFNVQGDILEYIENLKQNNLPIHFEPENMQPFTVQGKDLKSIEFIVED